MPGKPFESVVAHYPKQIRRLSDITFVEQFEVVRR